MLDVVVVGLGAMGSAAVYQLARRGLRVVGVDQFSPPHQLGSTHGRTRIIREAYFEHPSYVPIVQRAYELWHELERESGRELLITTGGLMIGAEHCELVAGARRSAEQHGLAYEMLSAAEVRRRYPALVPASGMVALLEPRAGILLPELCVGAYLDLARAAGAELRTNERVLEWKANETRAVVRTTAGTYEAGQLVLAAGPWLPGLLERAPQLAVERQLFHWYEPRDHREWFAPGAMPISLWEDEQHRIFAAFADLGDGVKFGIHHEGEITTPDTVNRQVTTADDEMMGALVRRFMPSALGTLRESRVCLYTNTPDHNFIIDRDPSGALIVSPCSGHGFKFASAIGEIVADLVMKRESRFDLSLFSADRAALLG
ncbi:MAG: N-methyl-L-tryptophan oxidase [Gemmatimonadota bacterium]|nr:N-methyl-L-tryptophan oxidase [Gemmatimonadota bacterium]